MSHNHTFNQQDPSAAPQAESFGMHADFGPGIRTFNDGQVPLGTTLQTNAVHQNVSHVLRGRSGEATYTTAASSDPQFTPAVSREAGADRRTQGQIDMEKAIRDRMKKIPGYNVAGNKDPIRITLMFEPADFDQTNIGLILDFARAIPNRVVILKGTVPDALADAMNAINAEKTGQVPAAKSTEAKRYAAKSLQGEPQVTMQAEQVLPRTPEQRDIEMKLRTMGTKLQEYIASGAIKPVRITVRNAGEFDAVNQALLLEYADQYPLPLEMLGEEIPGFAERLQAVYARRADRQAKEKGNAAENDTHFVRTPEQVEFGQMLARLMRGMRRKSDLVRIASLIRKGKHDEATKLEQQLAEDEDGADDQQNVILYNTSVDSNGALVLKIDADVMDATNYGTMNSISLRHTGRIILHGEHLPPALVTMVNKHNEAYDFTPGQLDMQRHLETTSALWSQLEDNEPAVFRNDNPADMNKKNLNRFREMHLRFRHLTIELQGNPHPEVVAMVEWHNANRLPRQKSTFTPPPVAASMHATFSGADIALPEEPAAETAGLGHGLVPTETEIHLPDVPVPDLDNLVYRPVTRSEHEVLTLEADALGNDTPPDGILEATPVEPQIAVASAKEWGAAGSAFGHPYVPVVPAATRDQLDYLNYGEDKNTTSRWGRFGRIAGKVRSAIASAFR